MTFNYDAAVAAAIAAKSGMAASKSVAAWTAKLAA